MLYMYTIFIHALCGAALVQLTGHYISVYQNRTRIKLFWVHFWWSFGCLLGVLQFIGAFWRFYPTIISDNFTMACMSIIPFIWVWLLNATFPIFHARTFKKNKIIDLQAHYFSVSQTSYGLWAVIIVFYFLISSFLLNDGVLHLKNIFRLSYFIVATSLTFERIENLHYKSALHGSLITYSVLKFIAFIILFSDKNQ